MEVIVKDQRRAFPVCIKLEIEYGIKDRYLGVPIILGKNSVERIIELDLNGEEKALMESGRKPVRESLCWRNLYDFFKVYRTKSQ